VSRDEPETLGAGPRTARPGDGGRAGHETGERLKSLARAVMYPFFGVSTFQLVIGESSSATANGNHQSQAILHRASIMSQSGGRILVGLLGVVVLVIGALLAREGWTKEFLRHMKPRWQHPRARARW